MAIENLLNFFISSAHAAAPLGNVPPPPGAGNFQLLIMLVIFLLFLYFTVWRPQSKRAKEHTSLLGSLAKGDEVVTAGGILGKVSKVSQSYIVLAVADNVEMTVQKSSISSVLPKGTMKSV
jgi:preprotein translocase subunit YajC